MKKEFPRRVIHHYDYIQARKYAEANGKKLSELMYQEMQMFKVQAESVDLNETIQKKNDV